MDDVASEGSSVLSQVTIHDRSRAWIPLFAGILVLAACAPSSPAQSAATSEGPASAPASSSTAAEPSATSAEAAESILQALHYLSAGTSRFAFTDWVAVKASLGVPDLTSAATDDERGTFAHSLNTADASDTPFSFMAANVFLVEGLLTSWGFDNLDLDWEASVTSSLGIAYVLRLRDGFDVAPLLGKLDERGFGTEVTNGVTVRSHVMSNDDWVLTDLAFLNVALMPDGRTLVMSSQPDALKQSLAERGRLAGPEGPPVIRDAVAALDHPSGAWLDFSLDRLCDPISHARSDATRTAAEELLGEVGPLHPYTLVALGYRPDLEPTGRIVFGYVDPADAGADLEGRRRLAAEGLSVETGAPIENRLFSLVDANVEGGSLVLRVGPPIIDDPTPRAGAISLPRFLLGMAFRYDMLFAACDISL